MNTHRNQQGLALLMLVFFLALITTGYIVKSLNSSEIVIQRDKNTTIALAEAKDALIGYTIKNDIATSTFLPNPDLKLSAAIPEGSQSGMAGAIDISLLGKLPWYSLDIPPPKDGWGECLWYAVSGRFKTSPKTAALNWDTLGQIDVIDANGNLLASNLAALIVAPNVLLTGQDRTFANLNNFQCGGNYDAKNYLDTLNAVNAVSGEVNYFQGSINNRSASNSNNKRFVFAKSNYYNDRFIFLTTEEIFRQLIKRSDFAIQIGRLLDDVDFKSHLQAVVISGNKGTANLNCNVISDSNSKTFCQNWSEMLLLTELSVPAPILIDGLATPACDRVLIFGGQKTILQSRLTVADKNNIANYVEGSNVTAFATPIAHSNNFEGTAIFNPTNSSEDVMRCL